MNGFRIMGSRKAKLINMSGKDSRILLGHGSGGKLTHELIDSLFVKYFSNPELDRQTDAALLNVSTGRLAFTTDAFVVDPIFFPGGDIGKLAVCGTVNDVAVSGAKPLYLSAAFIIEEGFPMEDLERIVISMAEEAKKAGVSIVTGDTKVVEKGKGDRIYINTTGIGRVLPGMNISPERCSEGDAVIINGTIGDHGIAILSEREGLAFESTVKSDTLALNRMMMDVFRKKPGIHVLRDPTRGGVASALNEICLSSRTGIRLVENKLPVTDGVRGACEVMGLDPLYIANEGKILVILPQDDAEEVVSLMKAHEAGEQSRIIGTVTGETLSTRTASLPVGECGSSSNSNQCYQCDNQNCF